MSSPSYVAHTNIAVSRFVKLQSGSDHRVVPCGAGDIAIGVSIEAPQDAVLPGQSIGPAAEAGHTCRVYGMGENCEVIAGGTVTAGQFVKPDANAAAVAAGTGERYSGFCRAGGVAGERLQITIEHGTVP